MLAQLEALDLIAADIDLVIIVENLVEARALKDQRQLVTGALAVSILAVVADLALIGLQKRLTSPGLRKR